MAILLKNQLLYRIRVRIWIIIAGLAISGLTAFPIQTELAYFVQHQPATHSLVNNWLDKVYFALQYTNNVYPFLSYGTDWLAFAHLMLAMLFIGPLKDPVKNVWVIQFGLFAAIMIFPLAFIAGGIRGIPLFWQLIDCSFGVVALVVLLPCYRWINRITAGPAT